MHSLEKTWNGLSSTYCPGFLRRTSPWDSLWISSLPLGWGEGEAVPKREQNGASKVLGMAVGEGLEQDLGYVVLIAALSQLKSPLEMFENFQNKKLKGICSASCMKDNVEMLWDKVEADRNTRTS